MRGEAYMDLGLDEVNAYLTSTGWVRRAHMAGNAGWLLYEGYGRVVALPAKPLADWGRRVEEVLAEVAEVEGRPLPAVQVAMAIRARRGAAGEKVAESS